MRVIYKAWGFDVQHKKKQTPVSENVTGIRGAFEVPSWLAAAALPALQKASKPVSP